MRKVFIFQVFQVEDLDSPERATCSFFSLKDKESRVRSEIEHHPISLAVSPVCEYLREASSRSCRRFNSSERDRLVSQFSWKPSSGEKKKKDSFGRLHNSLRFRFAAEFEWSHVTSRRKDGTILVGWKMGGVYLRKVFIRFFFRPKSSENVATVLVSDSSKQLKALGRRRSQCARRWGKARRRFGGEAFVCSQG